MTRISTRAANSILLSQNTRLQKRLFDGQVSMTSEKKTNIYQGIASDSRRLINIENSTTLMQRFTSNNEQMDVKLNIANTSVEAIRKILSDFRTGLGNFSTTSKKGEVDNKDIQDQAFLALKEIEGYLNIDMDGQYLFSGNKVLTEPINFGLTTLDDFQSKFNGDTVSVATTRNAALEDFSYSQDVLNQDLVSVESSNFLQFDEANSTITATSSLFNNLTVGSTISVNDSASNNGTYQVTAVSTDGKTATVKTRILTDTDNTQTATKATTQAIGVAQKQIDEITLSNVYGVGDVVSVNVDGVGALTYKVVANDLTVGGDGTGGAATNAQSLTHIASKVTAAINADTTTMTQLTSATSTGAVIRLIGAVVNTTITTVVSATEASPTITFRDPDNVNKTINLTATEFGSLTFNKATGNISSALNGALQNIPVGTAFTVSGSSNNDGKYTVKTNDGNNLVIDSLKLTDEGFSGDTFYDLFTNTDVNFDAATKTIEIRQTGTTTPVPNSFNGMTVGQAITLSGSVTNSGPFTIASISSDGSSITVAETISNETDTNGVDIVSTNNSNFSYKSDSQLVFNSTNETIQLTDNASNAIVNAFGGLSVGMKISVSSMPTSSNNATYTISSISSDGSTITVDEDILTSETDTDGARISSFGAAGTISANSYYDGDEQTTTHRVSKTQSFTRDIDGIDPAFEKGIRALQLIAQGVYGTAGGLDQNTERVDDALNLIKSSLQRATASTLPFGAELSGNMEQLQIDIGYHRFQMQTANEINKNLTAFFDSAVADIENADLQATVVKLLDDQVALEASYQAYSRISQLSLTNFL